MRPYFIHSSKNHQIPPLRARDRSVGRWFMDICYLAMWCYWFTACCFFIRPKGSSGASEEETLGQYLRRIKLPLRFVTYYLIPLLASVTTCSHDTLLNFPAFDIIDYERRTYRQPHYTVVGGVHRVQSELSAGQRVRFGAKVTTVENLEGNVQVNWINARNGQSSSELFDHVIMAVTPDVVGSIFAPLRSAMSVVPTATVQSIIHRDISRIPPCGRLTGYVSRDDDHATRQPIHICTNTSATKSTHEHPSSVLITACPIGTVDPAKILHQVTFTRVLRTPKSRKLINQIFGAEDSGNAVEKM